MVRSVLIIVLLMFFSAAGHGQIPERRTPVGETEFGWFAAPTPIVIEGIGSAYPLFGLLSNIYESMDIVAVQTLPGGDFDISGAFVDELPVFTKQFQVVGGLFKQKAPFIQYDRGIDSDPDDFIQPLSEFTGYFYAAELFFWEERLQFFYQYFKGDGSTLQVFDSSGNLLSEERTEASFEGQNYGAVLDLTDDREDPRKGFNLGVRFIPTESSDPNVSDIFTTDYNVTGYIPMFERNSLVLNFWASTSSVTRQGLTDETEVRSLLDQGCTPASEFYEQCLAAEDKLVQDYVLYNRYGLATPLGGVNQLRGFPLGRFRAGNASFRAIEYRINFSEEPKNINWYVLGGVRTLLQIAVFVEQGTVSEEKLVLNSNLRTNYGVGVRALISGFVYRFDIATGDEGVGVNLFIDYPLQLNPIAGT